MKIKDFGVEIWMNRYENDCAYNLAETCVESLTVGELLDLSGSREAALDELTGLQLTYGAIEGSDRLRDHVAALYRNQQRTNVITAHGTIGANALVHETLVEPGDRVVSVLPTYQQHYSIPESYGADVRILHLREENGFLPDLDELRELVGDRAKLIAINNPNNPTGALMDEEMLRSIAQIAREAGAYVLSDEVYRGVDQEGDGFTTSIADLYERGISTGGMSKSFSLAGLRLGWIVGPEEVIGKVAIHRDYNTISTGVVDDYLAVLALDHKDTILDRSRRIVRDNVEILDKWIANEPKISWIRPRGGTVALLKYDSDIPSHDLAKAILSDTGVLFTPSSALDVEGYLRIGFGNNREALIAGLERLTPYFARVL